MRSIEQLTEEILSLPNESRAILADKLVESLEFDTDSAIQEVWVSEAKRRRDEILNGSVQPIPGEDALAQVRRLSIRGDRRKDRSISNLARYNFGI